MIELAVDNTNVVTLDTGNLMDMAGMARRFADNIEKGEWGDVTRVIAIVEYEGTMAILPWGENTSPYELMGMFEAAKLRVFADDLVDDE